MSALDELINKWVKKNHPEAMPGLEVCLYEASLIEGLDWAAEEGAADLAQLRNRIAELEENAKLFIKYIKNGENQKSHLQMLVLESCLTKSPEPPKEAK
jgi:hypothetical protein